MSIIKENPDIFGEAPFNPKESLMCFGLEIAPSWKEPFEKGLKKLKEELKRQNKTDFRIVQVKEKFGSMCIHAKNTNEELNKILREIESECSRYCEECGAYGSKLRRIDGWFYNLCEECASKKS